MLNVRTTIVLGGLLLAGCSGGGTVYYASGVDLATRDADFGACQAQARMDFPIRTETRFTTRFFRPPTRTCTADGSCSITPGYWEGGERYTVDVNADDRQIATRACMGSRGYARVGLPVCAPETAVRMSTIMPPLADGTCLYNAGPGAPLIVNPVTP
jgi:hypothetical protein